MVPSSGWTASWPPAAEPIAHGDPTSPGSAVDGVVAALAVHLADRMDGRQVDDVETHRGRAVELADRVGEGAVPERPAVRRPTSAPQDRGKNSYQEPKAASGRSTQTATGSAVVISSRIGSAVSTGQSSIDSAGPIRSATDLWCPAGRRWRPRWPRRSAAPVGRRPAPAAWRRSPGRWPVRRRTGPAATLTSTHVPPGGQRVAPGLHGVGPQSHAGPAPPSPSNRLLQSASRVIRISGRPPVVRRPAPRRPAGRQSTFAPTPSWPSRKTVAETVIRSPTTALAG